MKKITSVKELQVGDVVLVSGYDNFNFASGDADGWFSELYSISAVEIEDPDGVAQPGVKLVKPEGEPLKLELSSQLGWMPLYDEGDGIILGYDGGAHACSLEVFVVLLQHGRMSDVEEDEDFDKIMDSQAIAWEN